MLEPPANAADEAAVVAATGLALPDDLRALHAVHDGTFAPRLPAGMSDGSVRDDADEVAVVRRSRRRRRGGA